jgi:hypothetical protein
MPSSSFRIGLLMNRVRLTAIMNARMSAIIRAIVTSRSAFAVALVASATAWRVLFRSVVALAPRALSTAAIAGLVRRADIVSAAVLRPPAAASCSSRAAARSESSEARICVAERSRL